MRGKKDVIHDPDSTWPYGTDWKDVLAEIGVGAGIASAEIIVPDGLTLVDQLVDGTRVTAVITGGTPGETYEVTYRVTLTVGSPYTQDGTRRLICRQK